MSSTRPGRPTGNTQPDNAVNRLSDLALRDTLPPSIADDDQVTAIADGLDPESHSIASAVSDALPWMPNLGNLPERIVDLLAWQFHVDYSDDTLTLDQKRALVRQSIAFHRQQGTRKAVQDILDTIFGAGNAELSEWFEYGGAPFTFKVATAQALDQATMTRFTQALDVAKSVRSHYDFQQWQSDGFSIYVGFVSHTIKYRTEST